MEELGKTRAKVLKKRELIVQASWITGQRQRTKGVRGSEKMITRKGTNTAIRGARGLEPQKLGGVLWVGEKPTAESEGTSFLLG